MTEHLRECELTEPCGTDTPKHGFCGRQSTYCIHCERACICQRLRACEERAIAAAVQRIEGMPWTSETWLAHAERAALIAVIKGDQP